MMSSTMEAVEAQALKLTPDERAELIERLAASLVPEVLHPDWEAEIAHRLAELDAGRVELVDGEEVFRSLRARLGGREPGP